MAVNPEKSTSKMKRIRRDRDVVLQRLAGSIMSLIWKQQESCKEIEIYRLILLNLKEKDQIPMTYYDEILPGKHNAHRTF